MYKNLNPASFGVSGRQSELIELMLTYGFRGLDLDAADLLRRATLQGTEEASKYIHSAKIKIGGWTVPVQLGADDGVFQSEIERLSLTAETARKVGFTYGTLDLQPASDKLPYHENFERHRQRLSKLGDVLAGAGLRQEQHLVLGDGGVERRALFLPVACGRGRILGKHGGLVHFALFQTHAVAVFKVDRRNN